MGRRLLLTGATGFIGRNLVEILQAGYEVHAVSRQAGERSNGDVTWHEADLLDRGETARLLDHVRAEYLVHLAWYAEHGLYWEAPENLAWASATIELFEAFAEAGGRRAVVVGTCAEYEWERSPCVENLTPLIPRTLYGISKDATHRIVAGFAERVPFELAWGRPFLLYGPGEDRRRLISHVACSLLRGEPARVTDGTPVRDFMHVKDVARALAAVLDSELTGPVNISSGVGISLREVIERVAQAAGAPDLVRFGAIPQRPGEPPELVGCAELLHRETAFSPAIELDRGIRDTVEWWRARLDAEDEP